MKKKNILICLDRDGCLIHDNRSYPGHTKNWKNEIKILPHVIQGIRLLNKKLPNAKIALVTNQSGIAIADFPLLTAKRAREVDDYIIYLLKKRSAEIHAQFMCPYVPRSYTKAYPQFKFLKAHVRAAPCRKPKPGMIREALKYFKFNRKDTAIYMLGDRATDVRTALNIKGFGILTPFVNRPDEPKKVKALKSKSTYISRNFKDACEFIIKRENK